MEEKKLANLKEAIMKAHPDSVFRYTKHLPEGEIEAVRRLLVAVPSKLTLADVLFALGKNRLWFAVDSDGYFINFTVQPFRNEVKWNLSNNFDNQDEDIHEFLYKLLVEKS